MRTEGVAVRLGVGQCWLLQAKVEVAMAWPSEV